MTSLAHQESYWDQASQSKTFSHPLDLQELRKFIGSNSRILDYGCGQGRLCRQLAKAGFIKIEGVDYSEQMIEQARLNDPSLNFSRVDGYTLPYVDQSFDAVILFAVLTCIPSDKDQKHLIMEIRRVLHTGGLLLISDYPLQTDERNLARYNQFQSELGIYGAFKLADGGIVRHHSPEWFSELLQGFSINKVVETEAKTMNGNLARINQIWAQKI